MTWIACKVRTAYELRTASNLRKHYEVYCPHFTKVTKSRRHRGRDRHNPGEKTFHAAYAGYLFIQWKPGMSTIPMDREPYFYHVLRLNGEWAGIPDKVIDGLKGLERQGVFAPSIAGPLTVFGIKSRVRVAEGPLGGMYGFVTAILENSVKVHGEDFKYSVQIPVLHLEKA